MYTNIFFLKKIAEKSNVTEPVNVNLQTRLNSGLRNYFYAVSVENQIVPKKRWFGIWPESDIEFASKVIQKGNILSLVEFEYSIDKDSFWDQAIYSRLVLGTFWTFNAVFRFKLVSSIHEFGYEEALVYYKELDLNFYPYQSVPIIRGGEYEWARLKKYPIAAQTEDLKRVFEYDYRSRLAVKLALKSHCLYLLRSRQRVIPVTPLPDLDKMPADENPGLPALMNVTQSLPARRSFLEMLKPIDTGPAITLGIIKSSLELAKAPRNIFSPPILTLAEKKPKGFNGTVGAMVSFFFELKFFNDQFSKEDIVEAFLADYKIEIPKYKGNFNFFDNDYYYNDLIKRLKKLKISPL